MFVKDAFIAGVVSVLSFGQPVRQPYPFAHADRALTHDWQVVGRDLSECINTIRISDETT